MGESTPGQGSDMSEILKKLQTGAQLTEQKEPSKPTSEFGQLIDPRQQIYDQVDQAILAGLTHEQAIGAVRPHLQEYHGAQSALMRDWLGENNDLIHDGYAQLQSLITSHPNLIHPDIRSADIPGSGSYLSNGIRMIPEPMGPRWDIAQLILSLTGPTAHAGLTTEKDVAGDTGQMLSKIINMLEQVGDGTWYGPHNLIGKPLIELDARGLPYSLTNSTGSQIVTQVLQMGFIPRRVFPPHNPQISKGATIAQPILDAHVVF